MKGVSGDTPGLGFLVLGSLLLCCGLRKQQYGHTPSDGSIPAGYTDLCNVNAVNCAVGASPLDMVGTFTGTGTTTVTSNETWRVGDSDSFKAVITTLTGETLNGSFELGGYHMDVPQAGIRGTSTQFTIFGTNSISADTSDAGASSTCSWEARCSKYTCIAHQMKPLHVSRNSPKRSPIAAESWTLTKMTSSPSIPASA